MKRLLTTMLLAMSAFGFSFSTFAVNPEDRAEIEWMESRYGTDQSNWPIYDTKPDKAAHKAETDVMFGPMTDPNHGLHRLERRMGNH